ncbi:MAG: exopolyphosphatase [Acidobacteriota bacterium]
MRLITRGDLDGLACAVIITHHEKISEIVLVHPQDITDRKAEVSSDDIIANLPYHPNCGLWFDHHLLTSSNRRPEGEFKGSYAQAPSAALLVWEYYGKDPRFEALVEETNRLDSAQLTEEDVLRPQDYILLGYTIDSRTGLGAFEVYFRQCVEWVKELPIHEVLKQPMVAERVRRLEEEDRNFRKSLLESSHLDGNVVFTDFRNEVLLPIGNRFLVYTLFPKANVSVRVHWGPEREFVVVAVAHSIFNRTCNTAVGELLSQYGGGGHRGAGSAPIPTAQADDKLAEIVAALKAAG